MLAGRLLVGIGGVSMLTPLYLAEIAPAKDGAQSVAKFCRRFACVAEAAGL